MEWSQQDLRSFKHYVRSVCCQMGRDGSIHQQNLTNVVFIWSHVLQLWTAYKFNFETTVMAYPLGRCYGRWHGGFCFKFVPRSNACGDLQEPLAL